jgi:nucleoside-diphosphate-sugar epimerase
MIFVTGGTGLVGRHVLLELRDHGVATTALVRDQAGAEAVRRLGATPVGGRVEEPATWDRVEGCTAIVHCAAIIATRAPWARYREVNVDSARLASARALGLGIPLVHLSSVAVYGPRERRAPDHTVDESSPLGSLEEAAFYPRSKRLAEIAVREAMAEGLRALVLRPCLIYGEGDRQFLPRIVALARSGWLPTFGPGDRPLSLVHARNVAHAVLRALTLDRGWGHAFNVVNPDPISAREFIAGLGEGLGRRIRTVRIPVGLALGAARVGDVLFRTMAPAIVATGPSAAIRYWRGGNPFSVEALRQDLGWDPPVRHREGIPRAVRAITAGEVTAS